MKKLKKFCKDKGLSKIHFFKKGLYEKSDVLKFDVRGDMMTSINSKGNVQIEVDSIDNALQGAPASIIKMDIEGSEMKALYGAKNTIKNFSPLLCISAYHKRTDLFSIFEYIQSFALNYKWFFRAHKPLAIDAVLYAVPSKRIV